MNIIHRSLLVATVILPSLIAYPTDAKATVSAVSPFGNVPTRAVVAHFANDGTWVMWNPLGNPPCVGVVWTQLSGPGGLTDTVILYGNGVNNDWFEEQELSFSLMCGYGPGGPVIHNGRWLYLSPGGGDDHIESANNLTKLSGGTGNDVLCGCGNFTQEYYDGGAGTDSYYDRNGTYGSKVNVENAVSSDACNCGF